MKYTLFLTRRCNLACSYCYVGKEPTSMSEETAARAVDFIYDHAPAGERISVGFFGGEPLLEPDLLAQVAGAIECHPAFSPDRVEMAVVSNGTIYDDAVEELLLAHRIALFVSCDGPPEVHDRFRRAADGTPSSTRVEATLRRALARIPGLAVNAVLRPETLAEAPRTVAYFRSLGLRQVHLSPDFGAAWSAHELELLPEVLAELRDQYVTAYEGGRPFYLNLLDAKIAVMLRGGYRPQERCRLGRGEIAIAPSGRLYPCERLIGDDAAAGHCIGTLGSPIDLAAIECHRVPDGDEVGAACRSCGLRELCMNWCGCSNYFATGFYNRVSPFQCAFERAAITAALEALERVDTRCGPVFAHHLSGTPELNGVLTARRLPVVNPIPQVDCGI